VAAVNVGLTLVVAGLAALRRRRMPWPWLVLAVLALVASFMMFPVSSPFWRLLPKLRYVQFPWRFLFVDNAVAAFLFAAICYRLRRKFRIAAITFFVVLFGVMLGVARIKHGWPGRADKLRAMTASQGGYLGLPEYLPLRSTVHEAQGDGLFTFHGLTVSLHVERSFHAGAVVASARAPASGRLQLPLTWYPAWRAEVNGTAAPVGEQSGLVTVPVSPGANHIIVRFAPTPDRVIGSGISVFALLIVLLTLARTPAVRRKSCPETSRNRVRQCDAIHQS